MFLIDAFKTFIKQIFCKHEFKFHRNVYGDEINALGCRSIWVCSKCEDSVRRPHLDKF